MASRLEAAGPPQLPRLPQQQQAAAAARQGLPSTTAAPSGVLRRNLMAMLQGGSSAGAGWQAVRVEVEGVAGSDGEWAIVSDGDLRIAAVIDGGLPPAAALELRHGTLRTMAVYGSAATAPILLAPAAAAVPVHSEAALPPPPRLPPGTLPPIDVQLADAMAALPSLLLFFVAPPLDDRRTSFDARLLPSIDPSTAAAAAAAIPPSAIAALYATLAAPAAVAALAVAPPPGAEFVDDDFGAGWGAADGDGPSAGPQTQLVEHPPSPLPPSPLASQPAAAAAPSPDTPTVAVGSIAVPPPPQAAPLPDSSTANDVATQHSSALGGSAADSLATARADASRAPSPAPAPSPLLPGTPPVALGSPNGASAPTPPVPASPPPPPPPDDDDDDATSSLPLPQPPAAFPSLPISGDGGGTAELAQAVGTPVGSGGGYPGGTSAASAPLVPPSEEPPLPSPDRGGCDTSDGSGGGASLLPLDSDTLATPPSPPLEPEAPLGAIAGVKRQRPAGDGVNGAARRVPPTAVPPHAAAGGAADATAAAAAAAGLVGTSFTSLMWRMHSVYAQHQVLAPPSTTGTTAPAVVTEVLPLPHPHVPLPLLPVAAAAPVPAAPRAPLTASLSLLFDDGDA